VIDEYELRTVYPEIAWDEPVEVHVLPASFAISSAKDAEIVKTHSLSRWVCRYCIAMHGVKAQDVREGQCEFAYLDRDDALAHVGEAHHD
jgi:ribosomal protein L40E